MSIKIAKTLLLLSLASILLFAFIYNFLRKEDDFINALYESTLIQTLVGTEIVPKSRVEKIAIIAQSIVSYFFTAGIIVFVFRSLK